METLLAGLKAAAEPTRLRLLNVLSRCELTVSELTRVLCQSQPRVSRHLRLLCDAGMLERSPEGVWTFYRLADSGEGARLARTLLALLDAEQGEPASDIARLDDIRQERAARAAEYFRENARRWDRIRQLYVGEAAVETAIVESLGDGPLGTFVDLGTGTGRVLQLLASRIERGIGIDESHEMLDVARARLDELGLSNCQVRQGDLYAVPLPDASADVVTVHHVLHFLDDPRAALTEAARLLRPGGRLLVIDFAPHQLRFLRDDYAHRRLGFSDQEIRGWCKAAGLGAVSVQHLDTRGQRRRESLTVSLWSGKKPVAAKRAVA